jgi:MFS family permease
VSAPPARHPGRAFAGVFALIFFGLLAVGAVLPVLPVYVKGPLGDGNFAVGVVIGCYAISGLLLRPFAGRLADRRGRKPTAILGVLLISAGGFLYLPHLGLAGLIGARLVVGLGEGAAYTAASAWIVDLTPPARRGRILGLFGLAVWGGLAIGPLFGALIHSTFGYTAVWLFAAIVPLLGVAAVLRVHDPFRPLAHAEPHPLIAPEAIRPGLAVAFAGVGYATVASFVVLLLESRGVDNGAAVFASFGGAIVVTRLLAGGLPDRHGGAPVAMAAAAIEGCGLLVIAVAPGLPLALFGGVLMGTGFSLLNPSLMLITIEEVHEGARGAALGTFTAFFDAGVGIGAPMVGAAAALTSYEGAFVLGAAFALLSVAVTFFTVFRLGEGRARTASRA